MLVHEIDGTWYSWIPTNFGKLNFNYIADELSLADVFGKANFRIEDSFTKKNIILLKTNLSDTSSILLNKFILNEISSNAYININNNNKYFSGKIKIFYNKLLEITSFFKVELDGKIIICDALIKYDEELIEKIYFNDDEKFILDNTVITAIYTLIKKIIHGDHHHEQKIDTFMKVYKNNFTPCEILEDFGIYIKKLDKFVKNTRKEETACHFYKRKMQMRREIDGIMSYVNTFNSLFNENEKCECMNLYIKTIKNIVDSIMASINKADDDIKEKRKVIAVVVSFAAFIISIGILSSNLMEIESVSKWGKISPYSLMIFSIVFVMFHFLFANKIGCYLDTNKLIGKDSFEYYRFLAISGKVTLIIKIKLFIKTFVKIFISKRIVYSLFMFLLLYVLLDNIYPSF